MTAACLVRSPCRPPSALRNVLAQSRTHAQRAHAPRARRCVPAVGQSILGVLVAFTGTVLNATGLMLQKWTHNRVDSGVAKVGGRGGRTRNSCRAHTTPWQPPYFRHPSFILGLGMMCCGAVAGIGALHVDAPRPQRIEHNLTPCACMPLPPALWIRAASTLRSCVWACAAVHAGAHGCRYHVQQRLAGAFVPQGGVHPAGSGRAAAHGGGRHAGRGLCEPPEAGV